MEKREPIAFYRARDIVADRLAFFREEDSEPTANDKLLAGHLVGALWANDLLNTAGEKWVTISSIDEGLLGELIGMARDDRYSSEAIGIAFRNVYINGVSK